MRVYFVHFAGNFAEDVGDDAEDVVRVDLIDIALLDQAVVVVDVSADALLYCLQLRKDLLGTHLADHFRHLVDRVEEVALDLQFGVDVEERGGQQGSAVLELLGVDGELGLSVLDDCGQHREQVAFVDCPYLLQHDAPQPLPVLAFLDARVADDPLLVGVEARGFEVPAPVEDQLPYGLLVDLLLVGLGEVLVGVLLDELGEGLVELAEGVTDSVELLPHDRPDVPEPLLHLGVGQLVLAVGLRVLAGEADGGGLFHAFLGVPVAVLREGDIDMQIPEYLLEEALSEDDLDVFGLGFFPECGDAFCVAGEILLEVF